jgi:hypothetical protein
MISGPEDRIRHRQMVASRRGIRDRVPGSAGQFQPVGRSLVLPRRQGEGQLRHAVQLPGVAL